MLHALGVTNGVDISCMCILTPPISFGSSTVTMMTTTTMMIEFCKELVLWFYSYIICVV